MAVPLAYNVRNLAVRRWTTAFTMGGIALDRRLFTSMSYPADYGYIEGT